MYNERVNNVYYTQIIELVPILLNLNQCLKSINVL